MSDRYQELLDNMWVRLADSLFKSLQYQVSDLGRYDLANNPWPHAGFDFRLNKRRNRYPYEPEVCEYCGRSDDE